MERQSSLTLITKRPLPSAWKKEGVLILMCRRAEDDEKRSRLRNARLTPLTLSRRLSGRLRQNTGKVS
jgi:hypothetical protein